MHQNTKIVLSCLPFFRAKIAKPLRSPTQNDDSPFLCTGCFKHDQARAHLALFHPGAAFKWLYPDFWAVKGMVMKTCVNNPILHPPKRSHAPRPQAPVAPAPRVATWWLRRSAAHPAATLPSSLGGDSWTHPRGLKDTRKHQSATYSTHLEYMHA